MYFLKQIVNLSKLKCQIHEQQVGLFLDLIGMPEVYPSGVLFWGYP